MLSALGMWMWYAKSSGWIRTCLGVRGHVNNFGVDMCRGVYV